MPLNLNDFQELLKGFKTAPVAVVLVVYTFFLGSMWRQIERAERRNIELQNTILELTSKTQIRYDLLIDNMIELKQLQKQSESNKAKINKIVDSLN